MRYDQLPSLLFPFKHKLVLCKDRHLHIPNNKLQKVYHDIVQVSDIDAIYGRPVLSCDKSGLNLDIEGIPSQTMEKERVQ